jgi:hypothetical protein
VKTSGHRWKATVMGKKADGTLITDDDEEMVCALCKRAPKNAAAVCPKTKESER